MTTTNQTGSFEQLAGVPSAAQLSALANQLFPDLTGDIYGQSAEAEAAAAPVPAQGYVAVSQNAQLSSAAGSAGGFDGYTI